MTPEDGEQVISNPATANTVLSVVKNYMTCPICYDLVVSPIYQCKNGHIVCSNCIERVTTCGECRVCLTGPRIRNLALETISGSVEVRCPHGSEGCPTTTIVSELKTHLEACEYQAVNFCSKFLGRNECRVSVNALSILEHLESEHSIRRLDSSQLSIKLPLPIHVPRSTETALHFNPVIGTHLDTHFLVRTMFSMDGHIIATCFTLQTMRNEELKKFRVKFTIESANKEASVTWTGHLQSYQNFKTVNNFNSFRISMEFLRLYQESEMVIDVDVWKQESELNNIFLTPRRGVNLRATSPPSPPRSPNDVRVDYSFFHPNPSRRSSWNGYMPTWNN